MHWKGANPDNCRYHKHCREKTFSDFAFCFPLIIFHSLADKGRPPFLSRRKTKELLSHIRRMFVNYWGSAGSVLIRTLQERIALSRTGRGVLDCVKSGGTHQRSHHFWEHTAPFPALAGDAPPSLRTQSAHQLPDGLGHLISSLIRLLACRRHRQSLQRKRRMAPPTSARAKRGSHQSAGLPEADPIAD
jgi:hypothetical protein